MSSIADVFISAILDDKKFLGDVADTGAKGGDAAGKSFSQRFGQVVKTGAKAAVGGFGVALGAAVVSRFAQLERATADFRRETGATADEANRASKAINDMAGRNLQSVEQIGQTLTKVHTDLGLTGDEAERVTQSFLTFAQATGQEAAGAVTDFDDILDAWNLTADQSQMMDKLIRSHQKFGGSVEDSQKALAALAPAMRTANMSIDDGLELLNLFAASGIDAAVGPTALAKALTKVKSPAELKSLMADISNTADDFQRGQKAAALFGAKAGAKLSTALKGANLDDYAITMEDAAGATQDAADASLTLADRLKMGLSGIVSQVVDVFGTNGELIMALSGVVNLIAGPLGKVGLAIGTAIGAKVAGPIIGAIGEGLVAAMASTGAIGLAAAGLALAVPIMLYIANYDAVSNTIADIARQATGRQDIPLTSGD